jgi:hypothetical protein
MESVSAWIWAKTIHVMEIMGNQEEEDKEKISLKDKVILYSCVLLPIIITVVCVILALSKSRAMTIGLSLTFGGTTILSHFYGLFIVGDIGTRKLTTVEKIFAALAGLLIFAGFGIMIW